MILGYQIITEHEWTLTICTINIFKIINPMVWHTWVDFSHEHMWFVRIYAVFLHMRIPACPHTLSGFQWKKLTCMLPLLRRRESRRRWEMQNFAMICDDLRWPDFKTWLKDLQNLGSHPVCCARAFSHGDTNFVLLDNKWMDNLPKSFWSSW